MEKIVLYKVIIGVLVILLGVAAVYIAVNNNNDREAYEIDEEETPSETPSEVSDEYYLVDVKGNYTEGISLPVGKWIKAGEETTVSGSFLDGYSFVGWYDPEGNLLSKSLTYVFTPTKDVTLKFRVNIIHDAAFTVDISDTVASNGVAEKRIEVNSKYSVQIANQKWTFAYFGVEDPLPIVYDGDTVVVTISSYILDDLIIKHTVKYTDGTTSEKSWTYNG